MAREGQGEVHGQGGFTDAAFGAGDGDDLADVEDGAFGGKAALLAREGWGRGEGWCASGPGAAREAL